MKCGHEDSIYCSYDEEDEGKQNAEDYLAWLRGQCKCYPNHEQRLKEHRKRFLERHTRAQMGIVPEVTRRKLLELVVSPLEKDPAS